MSRRCSTTRLPFDQARYATVVADPAAFRQALADFFGGMPELFPDAIGKGYRPQNRRASRKLGLLLHRVRLKAADEDFTVRTSFALPYLACTAAEASGALFHLTFAVPIWAIARACGRDPMFWYSLETALGRNSVGTTLCHAPLPRAAGQQLTAWLLVQVEKLCGQSRDYSRAYSLPGGHRTGNRLDRLMRSMARYFEDCQQLHGSKEACGRHRRAWALLFNFRPRCPATARVNGGWRCPAKRGRPPPLPQLLAASPPGIRFTWRLPPPDRPSPNSVTVSVLRTCRPQAGACESTPWEGSGSAGIVRRWSRARAPGTLSSGGAVPGHLALVPRPVGAALLVRVAPPPEGAKRDCTVGGGVH